MCLKLYFLSFLNIIPCLCKHLVCNRCRNWNGLNMMINQFIETMSHDAKQVQEYCFIVCNYRKQKKKVRNVLEKYTS